MTGSEMLYWVFASAWGAALGLFYFGGLWYTLQTLPKRTRPRLWIGLSYLFRMLIILAGFWLVMKKDLKAFFFTLAAFFLMRFILTRKIGKAKGDTDHAN